MNTPTTPDPLSDPARLAELHASALLDSPAERAFDHLTQLATRLLDVPVALVSLVGEDHQFFKSCAGLGEPLASRRSTPLSHSFCQYVVRDAQPMVVRDARTDALLSRNKGVTEFGVVSYLGVPLTTPRGHTLGSFCVVDTKPRDWTTADIDLVRDLGELAMAKIELRLLAREFHAESLELRSLQLHREEMLQLLVHDLRNPLSAFVGALELTRMAGGLNERQSEYLGLAHEGGRMLMDMIDGILKSGRDAHAAAALDLGSFEPATIVAEACRQLAPLAEQGGVRLDQHAAAPPLVGDAAKLQRALVNLISNAIQHTPSGGRVEVAACPDAAGAVLFSVSDTGCGIPAGARDLIFQKYAGAGAAKLSGKSTGLGLPFSRRIIEAHGGRLRLESEPGRGTRIEFTIPGRGQPPGGA